MITFSLPSTLVAFSSNPIIIKFIGMNKPFYRIVFNPRSRFKIRINSIIIFYSIKIQWNMKQTHIQHTPNANVTRSLPTISHVRIYDVLINLFIHCERIVRKSKNELMNWKCVWWFLLFNRRRKMSSFSRCSLFID